jgi:hypothetical protein
VSSYRDLTPEELKYADRDLLAGRLASIQKERVELLEQIRAAEQRGRNQAVNAIKAMPAYLGDEGWNALAKKAFEADYDRHAVLRRRRPEGNFTALTIEAAYQHGYRTAAEVALKSGGAQ